MPLRVWGGGIGSRINHHHFDTIYKLPARRRDMSRRLVIRHRPDLSAMIDDETRRSARGRWVIRVLTSLT